MLDGHWHKVKQGPVPIERKAKQLLQYNKLICLHNKQRRTKPSIVPIALSSIILNPECKKHSLVEKQNVLPWFCYKRFAYK